MKKCAIFLLFLLFPIKAGASFDTFTSTKFGTYVAGCAGYYEPISTWTLQVAVSTTNNLRVARTNTDAWTPIEPWEEYFDWSTIDQQVAISTGAGMEFIFTLPINNQNWSQVKTTTHYPHTVMLQYYQFVKRLVQHYKGIIKYYEIWNEPNLPTSWNGELNPEPREYLDVLKTASRAIHEVDPNAVILLGGLAFPETDTSYLDRLLSMGGGDYFDRYNIHVYESNPSPSLTNAISNTNALMQKWNKPKPIWITEISLTAAYFANLTPPGTEEQKSAYLVKSFSVVLSTTNIERVIWHTLRNCGPEVGISPAYEFGLYDFSMSTLPAANAWSGFQKMLLGYIPQGFVGNVLFENYKFTKAGANDRYVLWPTATSRSGVSAGGYSSMGVRDLYGNFVSSYTAAALPSVVFYSSSPVYLEGIP